jgi:DTW domain-containing protein YfiP
MHPKEFKKVKNGTGHLTHLALQNSELFVGIDFTNHHKINKIIESYDSYVLYPSKEALNMSHTNPHTKRDMAIFIIDSTWSCSVKILRESKNLQALRHMSFDSTKLSQFKIKQQPAEFCLSTIESTLSVLDLLNKHEIENIKQNDLEEFLNPFEQMIEYQQKIIKKFSIYKRTNIFA